MLTIFGIHLCRAAKKFRLEILISSNRRESEGKNFLSCHFTKDFCRGRIFAVPLSNLKIHVKHFLFFIENIFTFLPLLLVQKNKKKMEA
jgi:hypothetical protein